MIIGKSRAHKRERASFRGTVFIAALVDITYHCADAMRRSAPAVSNAEIGHNQLIVMCRTIRTHRRRGSFDPRRVNGLLPSSDSVWPQEHSTRMKSPRPLLCRKVIAGPWG